MKTENLFVSLSFGENKNRTRSHSLGEDQPRAPMNLLDGGGPPPKLAGLTTEFEAQNLAQNHRLKHKTTSEAPSKFWDLRGVLFTS